MKRLFIILFLLVGSLASAVSRDELVKIQTNLEQRLTPIVNSFDPAAILYVKLKTQVSQVPQINIPFLLEGLPPRETISLSRIEIVVLSEKTLPESLLGILKEVSQDHGTAVSIRTKALPSELTSTPVVEKQPEPEAGWLQYLTHRASLPISMLFCTLLGIFAFAIMFLRLNSRTEAVYHGIEQVADALEVSGSGKETLTVNLPADEGLLALVMDCYWGKFDSYAAFLFKRMAPSKQISLFNSKPFLREYSLWLSDMPESDFGVKNEGYYHRPLGLSHLDNQTVTELVRKSPALFYKLSSLRRSALLLKPEERIHLMKAGLTLAQSYPVLENIASSSPRALDKRVRVKIDSLKEEAEILKLTEVSMELIESLPSLGWWYRIPSSELKQTLAQFRAKDLASAWVGPEEMLGKMRDALPKQKYYLVRAYLNRTTPNRESKTFLALHEAAVSRLRATGAGKFTIASRPKREEHDVQKAA